MQFNRDAEGNLTPLENRNIDTGLGLERMAQILQGVPNNYETDLIYPLIETAATLAGVNYRQLDARGQTSLKVIGDHSRAITQLIADGVTASNLGRGYILRRLLRRVVRHGRLLGITTPFLTAMGEAAIALMVDAYPQLVERRDAIMAELAREEARFLETLERGEKLLAEVLSAGPSQISGEQAFELYDTYGFPLELTEEIAEEHGLAVDLAGFEAAMEAQRQRAKARGGAPRSHPAGGDRGHGRAVAGHRVPRLRGPGAPQPGDGPGGEWGAGPARPGGGCGADRARFHPVLWRIRRPDR